MRGLLDVVPPQKGGRAGSKAKRASVRSRRLGSIQSRSTSSRLSPSSAPTPAEGPSQSSRRLVVGGHAKPASKPLPRLTTTPTPPGPAPLCAHVNVCLYHRLSLPEPVRTRPAQLLSLRLLKEMSTKVLPIGALLRKRKAKKEGAGEAEETMKSKGKTSSN